MRREFGDLQNLPQDLKSFGRFCGPQTVFAWDLDSIKAVSNQAPMLLVFLTPRQALSSHPCQQMVWLYWLQDRYSMPSLYTINYPTTLPIHIETQWPTAARRWHFAPRDVSRRQTYHLLTPSHPWIPPCDHTVGKLNADTGSLCSEV